MYLHPDPDFGGAELPLGLAAQQRRPANISFGVPCWIKVWLKA